MRLLIVGTLKGQLTTATKIAMDNGASVTHADDHEQAMRVLRGGKGADLLLVDVALDIRDLVMRLESEHIHVPIVACGISNDARAAVAAIHAGAKEDTGGTLLLDEISEMDVRLQSKLLRAIQERVIDRVGGTRPVPVDIRIIATSNRNLTEAVREGSFREDLLFRLNVVNLKIPPLRDRPADILELAQHFAKKYADANGVPLRPISADARRGLTSNRWQGNVRELENTIHRSVLMAQGDEIGPEAILTPDGDRLVLAKTVPAVAHATFAAEQVTRALVGRTVADVERDLILETLKHCLGNRTHAANILGISIRTLRNKLNEYADGGLPIPPAGSGEYQRVAAAG